MHIFPKSPVTLPPTRKGHSYGMIRNIYIHEAMYKINLHNQPTNSMGQNPSSEAESHTASQGISCLL
jgi:hypothetical protein